MPEVYLYGIVPSDRCWRPDGFAGVHGAPVRLVAHRDLAAFVSDVVAEVPGRRRELVAHTTILERALEAGPVLPAAFGTIAPGDEAVSSGLLARRYDRLLHLLEQVDGLVEVRLSGTYDEDAVVAEVLRRRPGLRSAPATAGQVEAGRRVAVAIEDQRRADVAELLDALGPRARQVIEQPPRGELGLADLAFLVHRDDLGPFDRAVAAATQALLQRAKVRYVGPLPPASFFSLDAA